MSAQDDEGGLNSSAHADPTGAEKLEFEAIIEEYRAVTAETRERIRLQHQIISYSLTIAAALIAISQVVIRSRESATGIVGQNAVGLYMPVVFSTPATGSAMYMRVGLLLISLLYSVFTMMYLQQDSMMVSLGGYVDASLRPRLEELARLEDTGRGLWKWNEYRSTSLIESRRRGFFETALVVFSLGTTFVPSLACLALYGVSVRAQFAPSTVDTALLWTAVAAALLAFGCIIDIHVRYWPFVRRPKSGPKESSLRQSNT